MTVKTSPQDLQVDKIQKHLRKFIAERDWEKYHTPKNLAMALSVEAAELMEIFQWMEGSASLDIQKDEKTYQNVKDEMADILSYLFQLAELLNIDLNTAFWEKDKKNALKYPKN